MTAPAVTRPSAPMKMGPGVLTFGATGAAVDVSANVTKCATKWKANADDDTVTLSGAVISGERTYTCQVAFTVYQDDMTAGGLIAFSWASKGQTVPFTFTPRSGGQSISGDIVVDPVDVGGDTNSKNTSDVTWDCVGEPVLADDL